MAGSPGRGPGGGGRRTGAQRVKAAGAAARGRRERCSGGGGPAASARVPGAPRVKRLPPPGGLNPELPLRARIRIR